MSHPKSRLAIVWNRDNPRYQLRIEGCTITGTGEIQMLKIAIDTLERALVKAKKRLEKLREVGNAG